VNPGVLFPATVSEQACCGPAESAAIVIVAIMSLIARFEVIAYLVGEHPGFPSNTNSDCTARSGIDSKLSIGWGSLALVGLSGARI
jgi:hypothetical protein